MHRWRWPLLFFVSTLGVRLIGLGHESLWYDEAFTANLAQLPLPQMIRATAGDVHPPAWYLITWLTTRLIGDSEFALRLPAAIFNAAFVSRLYVVIRNTTDHRAALWAAGFSLISAGLQYYGQEARQYSMHLWLVYEALHSLQTDNKWRFAPTAALSLYTHNLGAIYMMPLALIALWKWRKQALIPLALASASYLPWLGVLLQQIGDLSRGYWIAPGGVGGLLWYWVYGTFGIRAPVWAQLHVMITAIAITIAALVAMRGQYKKYLPLLAITVLPPLELFAVSHLWQPLMLPRALLPSSAGILSVWGLGISRMSKQVRTLAVIILLPMMAITLYNYFADPTVRRAPASEQTAIIESRWHEGDIIYHASVGSAVGFDYYLDEYDYAIMPGGDEIGGLSDATRLAMGYRAHELDIDTLIAQGYQRAFVVYSRSATISDQQAARTLDMIERFRVIDVWSLVDYEYATYRIYLIDLRS